MKKFPYNCFAWKLLIWQGSYYILVSSNRSCVNVFIVFLYLYMNVIYYFLYNMAKGMKS